MTVQCLGKRGLKQYINYLTLICQNFLLSQRLCCGQVPKFLVFIKPGLLKGGPVTQHSPMNHTITTFATTFAFHLGRPKVSN